MPIDPWDASSFGSIDADAPGMLRERGWTESYHVLANGDTDDMIGICSGSTETATNGSTLLPALKKGQSISIFGIQGANGQVTDGFMFTLQASGYVETGRPAWEKTLMAGAATKQGPWFQHFELPLRVDGPAGLYWKVENVTAVKAYNYLVLQYIIVDRTTYEQ